ncbi:MAG: site-specific DNA-methyltransferase [Planctomycetes bacterium]|nr:site-specific DNA-methyltransferase [Planctomycetota bacterium]
MARSGSVTTSVAPRHTPPAAHNRLRAGDRAAHDWYRFVLSFPPHLVRDLLDRFGIDRGDRVLDPFCGTGTTLVECKKLEIPSVGIEANPMACFASRVKVDWIPDPDALLAHGEEVAERTHDALRADGIEDAPFFGPVRRRTGPLRSLPPDVLGLLLRGSISPLPLHKTMVLMGELAAHSDDRFLDHERLALAKALIASIGNLHFGPEVGVGPAKEDAPVVAPWLECVRAMARDLRELELLDAAPATVYQSDSRLVASALEPESVSAVITSPPYPNEKDYTRTTRLESVLLGLIRSKAELRALKQGLVRSNTRTVFVGDDDDRWVADHPEVQRVARAIEARRVELRKTSGFERLYPRTTRLYFGGMARHLAGLRTVLRPGAQLAYVVGDQASYLRVLIRTGHILADIARSLRYEVVGIDLFRTRLATATREQLREEVVLLRWPGQRISPCSPAVAEQVAKYAPKRRGAKAWVRSTTSCCGAERSGN